MSKSYFLMDNLLENIQEKLENSISFLQWNEVFNILFKFHSCILWGKYFFLHNFFIYFFYELLWWSKNAFIVATQESHAVLRDTCASHKYIFDDRKKKKLQVEEINVMRKIQCDNQVKCNAFIFGHPFFSVRHCFVIARAKISLHCAFQEILIKTKTFL